MYFCDTLGYMASPSDAKTMIDFTVWSTTRIGADSIGKYVAHTHNRHLELNLMINMPQAPDL